MATVYAIFNVTHSASSTAVLRGIHRVAKQLSAETAHNSTLRAQIVPPIRFQVYMLVSVAPEYLRGKAAHAETASQFGMVLEELANIPGTQVDCIYRWARDYRLHMEMHWPGE